MSTPKTSTDSTKVKVNPQEKSKKTEQAATPKPENDSSEGGKSKADLRRERREIQERQRALKASGAKDTSAKKPPQQQQQQQKQPSGEKSATKHEKKEDEAINNLTVNIKATLKVTNKETKTTTIQSKVPTVSNDPQQKNEQTPAGQTSDFTFETTDDKIQLQRKKESQKDKAPNVVPIQDKQNDEDVNKAKLFQHFDQYKRDYSKVESLALDNPSIHPAFIKLGIQFAHDRISGSSARCIAFLNAFKEFLNDFKASSKENRTISKDLESKLKPNINFLTQCRPLSISMGNAIKEMKQVILHLPNDTSDSEAKRILNEEIEKFIDEKILLATETITKYMLADVETIISGTSYSRSKITNSDCLLIYGYSSLVTHVLLEARRKFPKMHVIVVDSRPKYKGKISLEQLLKNDINCSYVMINAVSFVMPKVTKVILGAQALLANGYVMGSIGSSQIALVAKSSNVPVVVCCETYKFCDKVQTDALVNNELGNPLDLLKTSSRNNIEEVSPLADWSSDNKKYSNLTILNLSYDVTPPDLISCVVTDMGMLPCTSVPVVLRLKNRDVLSKKSQQSTSDGKVN